MPTEADLFSQSSKLAPKGYFDVGLGALTGIAAFLVFGYDLGGEPHFADESAYIAQSHFAERFAEGDRNDPQWLTYGAYDLPPLPKYWIGGALSLSGYQLPPIDAARRWYLNTSTRFDPPGALTVARWPSVVIGMIGVLAIYAIGVQVSGRRLGLFTALLFIANPLYRMLARRAMSDVSAEAFTLAGLAFVLWGWKRLLSAESKQSGVLIMIPAGFAFGLAISSKFSAMLGPMIVGAWFLLGFWITNSQRVRGLFLVAATLMGIVAASTVVWLNPFLTAVPKQRLSEPFASTAKLSTLERLKMMTDLRLKVASDQQSMRPEDAVKTVSGKALVTLVQGFGRFGPFGHSPFDSTRRYDPQQDWGVVAWFPFVMLGVVLTWLGGRSQRIEGVLTTDWLILIQFLVALLVVASYLPMAWDRYFLPIQGAASLLGAFVVDRAWGAIALTLRGGSQRT